MLSKNLKHTIQAYLSEEFDEGRNIYFNQYFSSKSLRDELVRDILEEHIGVSVSSVGDLDGGGALVRISGSPILFWELPKERWLIVYSSEQGRKIRNRLQKIDDYVGWLIEVWIEGDVVDDLYKQFSPQDESINVERRWDPYYIYQRESDIPQELEEYYNEHINEFVEKGIEFNIKTPSWMVNEALNEGVQESLLKKSEISKSRFTYNPQSQGYLASDGGEDDEEVESGVTVRQGGQIVHRTGHPEATFNLIDKIEEKQDYYEEFEEAIPKSDSETLDNGIKPPVSYEPGKQVRIQFKEKEFDENASLTLSNLLTVGQNDVDIHGVIVERDELEFVARSYTSYDTGEYEVRFEKGDFGQATLLIDPISGSTSGLVYLFHKLREKFDPRVSWTVEDRLDMEAV